MPRSITLDSCGCVLGARISGLCYAEDGFVVIQLDNDEELWVAADEKGYSIHLRRRGSLDE
jgi:hypothetical protein